MRGDVRRDPGDPAVPARRFRYLAPYQTSCCGTGDRAAANVGTGVADGHRRLTLTADAASAGRADSAALDHVDGLLLDIDGVLVDLVGTDPGLDRRDGLAPAGGDPVPTDHEHHDPHAASTWRPRSRDAGFDVDTRRDRDRGRRDGLLPPRAPSRRLGLRS